MRTLLIVDDEAVVRALLRTLVDWQNEGFDRVGVIKNAFDRGQGSTHKKIYLLGMLSDSPFKF